MPIYQNGNSLVYTPVSQSVLDGVQGETLRGGESRARNHTKTRKFPTLSSFFSNFFGQRLLKFDARSPLALCFLSENPVCAIPNIPPGSSPPPFARKIAIADVNTHTHNAPQKPHSRAISISTKLSVVDVLLSLNDRCLRCHWKRSRMVAAAPAVRLEL